MPKTTLPIKKRPDRAFCTGTLYTYRKDYGTLYAPHEILPFLSSRAIKNAPGIQKDQKVPGAFIHPQELHDVRMVSAPLGNIIAGLAEFV